MFRPTSNPWGPALTALLICGPSAAQGIYTCVDAQGKRHTADRPIMECLDREQQELSTRGTVKRVLPPSLTAAERDALKQREQAEAERLARAADNQRKERALVTRYPNQAAHDKARADALAQVDAKTQSLRLHRDELERERQRVDGELEFYRKDPAAVPARLKHRQQENAQRIAAQDKALENQEQEKARVNARFDEELARLRQLWGAPATASR